MRIEITESGSTRYIVATPEFAELHFPGVWRIAEQQEPGQEASQQYAAAVVITSIAADGEHAPGTEISADLQLVDTSVGVTLSFTAELQAEGSVFPVDQTFRMPLVAADGSNDRRLIRVNFAQGVAQFDVPLTVSRHWRVDEATINLNLQPHERLKFAGLDVYVLE